MVGLEDSTQYGTSTVWDTKESTYDITDVGRVSKNYGMYGLSKLAHRYYYRYMLHYYFQYSGWYTEDEKGHRKKEEAESFLQELRGRKDRKMTKSTMKHCLHT